MECTCEEPSLMSGEDRNLVGLIRCVAPVAATPWILPGYCVSSRHASLRHFANFPRQRATKAPQKRHKVCEPSLQPMRRLERSLRLPAGKNVRVINSLKPAHRIRSDSSRHGPFIFGMDHPIGDGNGRTARLLEVQILMEAGDRGCSPA